MKTTQLFKKLNVTAIVTAMLLTIVMIFTTACETETQTEPNYAEAEYLELEKFKSEYKLKTITENNVIGFNSIEDAKLFIENLKNKDKEYHKMSFKSETSDGNSFTFSYKRKGNNYKGVRLKKGNTEEDGWYSSTGAGNFSSFNLNFNTSGANRIIDDESIVIYTSGFRIGWAYTQNNVTMIDNDSFIVKGTVSWGIGVADATLGYDQNFDLRIDIDWSTNTATWTEL